MRLTLWTATVLVFVGVVHGQVSVGDIKLLKSHGLKEEKILEAVKKQGLVDISAEDYFELKQAGFSEEFLKQLLGQVTKPKFPEIPSGLLRFYKKIAPQSPMSRVTALIIGVDNYRQTKFFPRLKFAVKDAESFARHLLSVGVPPSRICLLTESNVTRKKLEQMAQEVLKAQGVVYFFYSGHGLYSTRSGFYFTCCDTDTKALDQTAFSMAELKQQFKKMRAERLVMFLDACHSGAAKEAHIEFYDDDRITVGPMNQQVQSKVRELSQSSQQIAVITSCREDQVSREGTTNGLFTQFLLQGLSGKADRDKDGLVDTKEIFLHLNNLLPDKTNLAQMPDCKLSRSWTADKGLPTPRAQSQKMAKQQEVHILTPSQLRDSSHMEVPSSQWQLEIIGEIYGGPPVKKVLLDRREIQWEDESNKFSGEVFLTPGTNLVELAVQNAQGQWWMRTWKINRPQKPKAKAEVSIRLVDEDGVEHREFLSGETITAEVSWELPQQGAEPVTAIDIAGTGIRPYNYDYRQQANAEVDEVNCPIRLEGRNSGSFVIHVETKSGDEVEKRKIQFSVLPHLALEKEMPARAFIGQQLTYTIRIENRGESDIEDVFVKEELTPGLVYVFSDVSPLEAVEEQIVWQIPQLSAHMAKELTVTVRAEEQGRLGCTTRVRKGQRELVARTSTVDISEQNLAKMPPVSAVRYEQRQKLTHTAGVNCVSFSNDGQWLAASGEDATIQLWQVETGEKGKTLSGHTMPVKAISFSSDGRFLVSGSWDQTVRLWSTETGAQIELIGRHDGPVSTVAFAPDDKTIASGSWDKTIKVWNVEGRELHELSGHLLWVNSIAFSPDGKLLVSGGEDKAVKLWSLATGEELRTISGHHHPINSVRFSVTGRLLAAASAGEITLWSVASGKYLHTLSGHTDWVNAICFSPNGRMLASGSKDRRLTLWSLEDKKPVQVLQGHSDEIQTACFSHDGALLASGAGDGEVILWQLQQRE